MSQDIRRELISKNLGIKPINHGQVYTFQIAIPDSRKQSPSLEQRQAIEQSLLAHQSNLISLIIRRTDSYDDDIEYELVYGADWLQVAQELDIEKVWAWVFDLTDEQAIATITEMESLTHRSDAPTPVTHPANSPDTDVAALIDKKLQLATESIKNSITPLLAGIRNELDEKLKVLNYKIDTFNSANTGSSELELLLDRLDSIQQQIRSPRKSLKVESIENPIHLLEASDQDLEMALRQINTQDSQISAAIKAVHYWKNSEQGLTLENLKRSAIAKTNSPHKIKGFAQGTYDRIEAIVIKPDVTTG